MNINIPARFDNVKTVEELTKLLTETFEHLRNELQAQPSFVIITSDEQEIPKNTPVNTILFKFDDTDVVKTGYYDGENQILP